MKLVCTAITMIGKENFQRMINIKKFYKLQISGKKNKILKEKFTMCYPYGDYTSDTVNILDKMKCSMALTVKVGAVPKNGYNHLELPRFDTNDFPKSP